LCWLCKQIDYIWTYDRQIFITSFITTLEQIVLDLLSSSNISNYHYSYQRINDKKLATKK
jgi:hypothetical protein